MSWVASAEMIWVLFEDWLKIDCVIANELSLNISGKKIKVSSTVRIHI